MIEFNPRIWKMLQDLDDERGNSYMSVAFSYAARLAKSGIPYDQLVSMAYMGVTNAERGYCPEKGPFLPYAWPFIRGEFYRYFQENWVGQTVFKGRLVYVEKIPEDASLQWVKHPREPEIDGLELLAEFGISERTIELFRERYLEGRSIQEMAARRGVLRGAINQRFHTARNKINRKIK